jgi:hypothetical protein
MVEEFNKVDYWGLEVHRGEQIVVGKYYKKQGHSSQSYILCDGRPTFIYTHLVITIKFNMTIAQHRQNRNKSGISSSHTPY